MPKLVLACAALAALSLVLPSQPSYDPYAWLVWGREIPFLELDTSGGPSWKPLPVVFTIFFAPFSKIDDGIPAALWLVVARTGGLLAMVFAFRLAGRLAGGARWVKVVAGLVAAAALFLTPQWLRYLAHGNEVPMTIAFMLWGLERHLDGDTRGALVLGWLACLLRPEVFPFLAVYAGVIFFTRSERRLLIAGLFAALPVLWIVPEWIGSGDPWGGWNQARVEPYWSLSLRDQPWLSALSRGHRLATIQLELAALVGIVFAVRRRERVTLVLTTVALVWLVLVLIMTEAGFSGNPRYFVFPLVIVVLLAGVGVARIAELAVRLSRQAGGRLRGPGAVRPAGALGAFLITLLLLGAFSDYLSRRFRRIDAQAVGAAKVAKLHGELADAVEAVGGPNAVTPYGAPTVNRPYNTHLAWILKVPLKNVEVGHGHGVVFYSRVRGSLPPADTERLVRPITRMGRAGDWTVFRGRVTEKKPAVAEGSDRPGGKRPARPAVRR